MCVYDFKKARVIMTQRSTRTKSLGKLEQAVSTLERAAEQYDDAMTPYFITFPEKKLLTDVLLAGLKQLRDHMAVSLDDI